MDLETYKCVLCNKEYKYQTGLDKHMRNKHNKSTSKETVNETSFEISSLKDQIKILEDKNKDLINKNTELINKNNILETKIEMFEKFQTYQPPQQTYQPPQQTYQPPQQTYQPQQQTYQPQPQPLKNIPEDESEIYYLVLDKLSKNNNKDKPVFDIFLLSPDISMIASYIYSILIKNQFVRISDKKRKIVEFLDDDNNITKSYIQDDRFLKILNKFTPHIISIIEMEMSNHIWTEEESIDNIIKLQDLHKLIKQPMLLIPQFKYIIDYNSCNTQKNIKALEKVLL